MTNIRPWMDYRSAETRSGRVVVLSIRPVYKGDFLECEIKVDEKVTRKFNADDRSTAAGAFWAVVKKEGGLMQQFPADPHVNWEHYVTPRYSGLRHEDFATEASKLQKAGAILFVAVVVAAGFLVAYWGHTLMALGQ